MRFHSPIYLLMLLIPIVIFIVWKGLEKNRNQKIKKYFSLENISTFRLIDVESRSKKWWSRILALTAYSFFVLALARPQYGLKQKAMTISEHSVVFLVDISRSMLTRDLQPSRLGALKKEIQKSLEALAEIRVGLVVFAGSVNVVAPMTSDLEAVSSYIDSLTTEAVSSQGTNIHAGLKEARGLFERYLGKDKNKNQSKIVVIFSDGENHQKESLEYTKKMEQQGYKIFTVGVGTESGGFIPEDDFSSSYIKDPSGQPVVSKPNFKFLKEMAQTGGGVFYYLSPIDPLGPKLKKSIEKMEGVAASQRKFVVRNEMFQLFIVLGCLVFILAFVIRRL